MQNLSPKLEVEQAERACARAGLEYVDARAMSGLSYADWQNSSVFLVLSKVVGHVAAKQLIGQKCPYFFHHIDLLLTYNKWHTTEYEYTVNL